MSVSMTAAGAQVAYDRRRFVFQFGDGRMFAAQRALAIAPQGHIPEFHFQRIIYKQPICQEIANTQQELYGFGGLNTADDTG